MADEFVDETVEAGLEFVDAETEYDLLFPIVPLVDDPYPPSDVATSEVDDLADFAGDEGGPPSVDDEPYGVDYAYDWDRNEFFSGVEGQPQRVDAEQAIVEWVMKALRTRKGEYAIYSADYGTNIDDVIGAAMPDHILASEVSQEVRACVLQHPRIVDCSIPGVRHVGDTLYVEIQMQLDTLDAPVAIGVSF